MWTEEKLDQLLTIPSPALIEDMRTLEGDLMILGAGGKMGPTLAILAKKALQAAANTAKVIAVSRFSDPIALSLLENGGVTCISCDLLAPGALESLPDVPNIIYMAGRKFGTADNAAETWRMNASLPTLVARRFPKARYVAFSTGNVYPMVSVASGGCIDTDTPQPLGEYGMSSLARERVFEGAAQQGASVLLYRLNYAVDLRYGVLHDLSRQLLADEPISLSTPCFNCVWQGYANEVALRALGHTGSPAVHLNVTGPEQVSVRYAATELGRLLGKTPRFTGEEGSQAFLSNAAQCVEWFGYPSVGVKQLIRWQAEWILDGGRSLGKPTHFEERGGKY